jgi:diguanylate cyclase (GGDEF)-like protein
MSGPTVLVADDDPTSIEIIARALKDIVAITFTTRGAEAVALARREQPELILLDVMMPDLDGIEVCRRLKADPHTRDIPVVFVSAAEDEAEESRGLLAGAIEYVAKPIRPALLAARVRNLLELGRRRDELAVTSPRDEVTGLHSRRGLEEALAVEWRRAARADRPLSVAVIEVDDLAPLEELYGQLAGKEHLRRIGAALAGALRPGDLLSRFADNRFAALLPETDERGAAAMVERMREAVKALDLQAAFAGRGSRATVSVGATSIAPAEVPTPGDLVTQALRRLEEAIRLGRNRAVVSRTGAPSALPGPLARRTAAGRAGSLFIVDDDTVSIEALSALALRAGYDVAFARDGLEALRLIAAAQPDVVLLDVDMPGLDGFETCRRLKAATATASIPVIFLSSLTQVQEKVRAFEVGGADYVSKPFGPEEVLARIAHQIKITWLQADMRAANARLVELDRLRATFAAMLVHDLRSPLTVVNATIGLLARRPFTDDPELGELVGSSQEAMDRCLALVSEVLDIYRSEHSQVRAELGPGNVADVLHRCSKNARLEAERRGLKLETRVEGPLPARHDPVRLERAVTNLLTNALKFTPRGGQVTLEARLTDERRRVYIEVRDNGAGIPESDLAQVFELYRQGDTSERSAGVGLGLAIVKRIVEVHQGSLAVRSQLGVGTAFIIELPASLE